MPKLHFVHPDGAEARYALEGDTFKVGRAPDNDIVLPDTRASSHHLVLKRAKSGDYIVNDLGATNPTRINGHVVPLQELRDGDTLWIGDTYARYENPPPASVAPAPGRVSRAVSDAPAATGCFAVLVALALLTLAGAALAAW